MKVQGFTLMETLTALVLGVLSILLSTLAFQMLHSHFMRGATYIRHTEKIEKAYSILENDADRAYSIHRISNGIKLKMIDANALSYILKINSPIIRIQDGKSDTFPGLSTKFQFYFKGKPVISNGLVDEFFASVKAGASYKDFYFFKEYGKDLLIEANLVSDSLSVKQLLP